MKDVITTFTICVLLASGTRLVTLDREQRQQNQARRAENALVPADSSLVGIDANGNSKTPKLGKDGHLEGKGHLLVFVIHRDNLLQDVDYWNRVIKLLSESDRGLSAAMQYWGICDDGSACNSYQRDAQFSIFGYLDPYEMRIVAKSDANHEALLYDDSMQLAAHIATMTDPAAECNFIILQKAT